MSKKIKRNIFIGIIKFIVLIGIFFSIILAYLVYDIRQKYSTEIDNYGPIVPSIIYDINGKQIDLITIENRDPIKIEEIPLHVQNAFIAIEDKRFRSHHGLDFIRLTKAFISNITGTGREGGSTITQQLVKNDFLTPERSILKRKLPEAVLAIELERKYTKDEILSSYLNTINFGRGSYGIKNAAINYFGVLPKDLSIAQAAILASIPKSPTKYSKIENAISRQKIVLKLMLNGGFITKEEYENALLEKIEFKERTNRNRNEEQDISTSNLAPEFTTIIIKEVKKILNIPEDNVDILFNGYKIYATVDINMQRAAYNAFETNSNLKKDNDLEGALISIDPNNGFVKAMVGGKKYVKGDFNRALNALRQPGSSFKPLVYLEAIRKGWNTATVIEDSPYSVARWSPKNYDGKYRDGLTLLKALEISDNIVAVKLLHNLEIKDVKKIWENMDLDSSNFPNDLTLALGSITTTPIDMAKMYSVFANGGNKIETQFIYKIENKYGEVIYEANNDVKKIIEKEEAAIMTNMLENVVNNGTGRKAKLYQNGKTIPTAGKTGTTNDYISAWFTGYIPNLVTIVYVGNDDNKPMGRGMTGGGAALPIWKTYMQSVVNLPDYYIGKFDFIDESINDNKLIMKTIDANTGLLDSDGVNSREALFRIGTEPLEYETEYSNGIIY